MIVTPLPSDVRIDRARARTLVGFIRAAWSLAVPGIPYVHGWHIDEMCDHLEALYRCEIRDLVINVPPGMSKSLICNVFYPLWIWTIDPSFRFIAGSFDASLPGKRDGGKILDVAESEWWVRRWGPLIKGNRPTPYDFDTLQGGFRFATSPGGKGTGRHANMVIEDDPIKPLDTLGAAAVTKKALTKVDEWETQTLSTRRADPKTHRTLLVMQRLSFEDPTGRRLSRTPGVVHLRLPMRFESNYACRTVWALADGSVHEGGDRRTVDGELLAPQRFDEPATKVLEIALEKGAPAQLQQRPGILGGTIFRRQSWRFWSTGPRNEPCMCDSCFANRKSVHDTGLACARLPEAGLDWLSFDLAFKGASTSDYVAGTAWRAAGNRLFCRGIVNERMAFSKTKLTIALWQLKYEVPAERTLVEDKANGPAVESELPVHLVNPQGGKVSRAHSVEPLLILESVYLQHPDECPETWALLSQAEAFPNSQFDDLVDSLTQGLVWYRKGSAAGYLGRLALLGAKS